MILSFPIPYELLFMDAHMVSLYFISFLFLPPSCPFCIASYVCLSVFRYCSSFHYLCLTFSASSCKVTITPHDAFFVDCQHNRQKQ